MRHIVYYFDFRAILMSESVFVYFRVQMSKNKYEKL